MKAERLLAALGQLEEQYIEEAAPGAQGKRRASRVKRNAAAAAAMLLIFAGVFGTAMAVNAGFRQMVLSFFHIGQVESVPDHSGDGFGVSESDIGGLVKAEYIQLEDLAYDTGFGTICQVEREDGGAVCSVRFWAVRDGEMIALETQKNTFSLNWQGKTYQKDLYWCVNDGELSFYWDTEHGLSDTDWFAQPVSGRTDVALLYLSQGNQGEYAQYPMLYHLDTGKVEDILQGTGAENLSFACEHAWSDDLNEVIITCRGENGDKVFYFCDVEAKSLTPLSDLTGVEAESVFFADDDTLLLLQMTENRESCVVFSYDLNTAALTQTVRQEKVFGHGREFSAENYGMMFFGGRYGVYVEPAGAISVVDFKTGVKTLVNGFVFDPHGGFLSNLSNTKLLYSVTGEISDETLAISQLGMLDLKAKTFTVFDRESYENLQEWSLGWFDDDRVEIRSSQSGTDALYLYGMQSLNK